MYNFFFINLRKLIFPAFFNHFKFKLIPGNSEKLLIEIVT